MSPLGQWVARGGQIKLAASTGIVASPAALPAFQQAYGFALTPDQLVQLAGGDTAGAIAAARQSSDVNAVMVYRNRPIEASCLTMACRAKTRA